MNKEELIKRIKAAFPPGGIPGADNLVVSTSGEAVGIKHGFLGKPWPALRGPQLSEYPSAIAFFTPAAFRYYLPALMIFMLEDMDAADFLAQSLIRQLTLPAEVDSLQTMSYLAEGGSLSKGFEEFLLAQLHSTTQRVGAFIGTMHGFTKDQGQCVALFLRTIGELHPGYYPDGEPETAVARYWFKYSL